VKTTSVTFCSSKTTNRVFKKEKKEKRKIPVFQTCMHHPASPSKIHVCYVIVAGVFPMQDGA